MSERRQEEALYVPVWGIFLLFLGVVLLLQTLNILPWGLWQSLWRFWPVLIIAAGVGILLRRINVWLVSLLVLALFFTCLGLAVWQYRSPLLPGQSPAGYPALLDALEGARKTLSQAFTGLKEALDAGSAPK